ncbi:pre-mrna splicing factor protein [Cystoisospora suis]|uniref:Pre-mRNA-splicing factor 18 n=1 Tax=Cystoisospora suis TaxID=483139 RepID=A0A2C6L592_9APIC|nr:pre-mrna splicing factor protein [Cystoisospora suis]
MDLLKSIISQQKEAVSAEKKSAGQRWICRGKTVEQQREEARRKAIEEEKKRKREEIERLNLELLHHEDELMAGQRNAFLNPQDEEEDDDEDTFDKELGEPSHSRHTNGHQEAASRRGDEKDKKKKKSGEKLHEGASHEEGKGNGEDTSTIAIEGRAVEDGRREPSGLSSSSSATAANTVDEDAQRGKAGQEEENEEEDTKEKDEYEEGVKNDDQKKEGGGKEKKVSKETTVVRWVRRMLHEWEAELKARPDSEKHTAEGRFATNLQRQTRKDLKPLLRKLRAKELEADILEKLYIVVQCCDERKYRSAHDTYMLLAIGNAAWPVGVTMVGIHERAGRAKLFTSQVAHILNDETTRKYIQMIKRLMSFCQRRYPADPSQTISLSTIHI